MKIFGITLVKNEDDIIAETLTKASTWCDAIYVFDTGSEDSSWEVVLDLANKNSRIVPYRKESVPYKNGLRAQVFNAYKSSANHGDWWCRLDSDEIYIDDPRLFLKDVPKRFDTIYSASFQYYFTEKDLEQWNFDPDRFTRISVEDRLSHFCCNWSEVRFMRHSSALTWIDGDWPTQLSKPFSRRIRLKHFQYRSPLQIEKRLQVRAESRKTESSRFWYDKVSSWEDKITDSNSLVFDTGLYTFNEKSLPEIPNKGKLWAFLKTPKRVFRFTLRGTRYFNRLLKGIWSYLPFFFLQRIRGFSISNEPHFDSPDQIIYFKNQLEKCTFFLEFGGGGSTYLAAKMGIPFCTIDSDPYFLRALKSKISRDNLLEGGSQFFVHADIGLTGQWGAPLVFRSLSKKRAESFTNYSDPNKALRLCSGRIPDFILVDGRFRIACALKTILLLQQTEDWRLMVDDYTNRSHYHIIEKFADLELICGSAAVFKKRNLISIDELKSAITLFELSTD